MSTRRSTGLRDLERRLQEASTRAERISIMSELSAILGPSDARRAVELGHAALELAHEEGDPALTGTALLSLGQSQWIAGDFAAAIDHAKRALSISTELDDALQSARANLILGAVYTHQHRQTLAVEATIAALRLAEKAGDRHCLAIAHNALSVLYSKRGQLEDALSHRLECAALHQEVGDDYRYAQALINIGNVHWKRGEAESAFEQYDRAIELLSEIEPGGFPIAHAYHDRAQVHCETGQLDLAREGFERALEMRLAASDASGVLLSRIGLGRCALAQGELELAEEYLRAAVEQSRELGMPESEYEALDLLSQVVEAAGDPQEALKLYRRAADLRAQDFDEARERAFEEMRAEYEAERIEAEAAVERAILHAQKLESLGLMAGGVAHDFNNVLLSILGNAAMARELIGPDHEADELLELVEQSGQLAADLAQQMLTFAGRKRVEPAVVDLRSLLLERQSLLAGTIGSNIHLIYDCARVPAIAADHSQVFQIVSNLVLNAVEAGAKSIELSCRPRRVEADDSSFAEFSAECLPAGDYVALCVRDDGPGVRVDVRSRIFDPFFTTKSTGRGLGLPAVLGIARSHRAGVALREADPGTLFEVVFPTLSDSDAAELSRLTAEREATRAKLSGDASPITAASHSAQHSTATAGELADEAARSEQSKDGEQAGVGKQAERGGRSFTVLVVDDDRNVRKLVDRMLSSVGHSVIEAEDGRRAIDMLGERTGEIDAVLLDLTMPGMTAEETLAGLLAIDAAIPVVLSSGYAQEDIELWAKRDLVFLAKPYRQNELIDCIERAMRRDSTERRTTGPDQAATDPRTPKRPMRGTERGRSTTREGGEQSSEAGSD